MITKSISHELIIEDLKDIPSGQIFVLLNPDLGITSKYIRMMEFVFSMAQQFNQSHIVNTKPVDYSELWDCFACKIETSNGEYILVSDKDSLIEMLCEFWGLDFGTVCSKIDIKGRNKTVTCGGASGDCHPIRVSAPSAAIKKSYPEVNGGDYISLGLLLDVPNQDAIRKGIISYMVDSDVELTIEDLKDYLEEANKQRSITYELIVKIGNNGNKRRPKYVVSFAVKDSMNNIYHFKLETIWTAVYLNYLYSNVGISHNDFCDSNMKAYNNFQKIYDKLDGNKGGDITTPNTLRSIITNINKSISKALPNDKAARQFIILNKDGLYSIQDKNQTVINTIKSNFYLR